MSAPELTLVLGPPTRLGQALNAIVREHRASIAAHGVQAFPSRVGDKTLRELIDGAEPQATADNLGIGGPKPVLLTSTKGLAPPAGTFRSREMLPDAEAFLAQWARLAAGREARIILTIDPLPDFLFAMNHASANGAIKSMPWDAVYEMSWADVAVEVTRALPNASIVVVSTRAAFSAAETVAPLVFGAGAETASASVLRCAILEHPEEELPPRPSQLATFYERHRSASSADWLREQLGLDGVTASLLYDRFTEDLEALRHMPRVQLI